MKARFLRPRSTLVPLLALLGALGLAAHSQAQNAAPPGMKTDPDKTGVGPRGTKVGPSSSPTLSTQPASPPATTTGSGPRGTPTSPSTDPGAPTTKTPQQTR